MRFEEAFLVEVVVDFRVPFGDFAAFAVEDEVDAAALVFLAAAEVVLADFDAEDEAFLAVVFLVVVAVPAAVFLAVVARRVVFLGLGGL